MKPKDRTDTSKKRSDVPLHSDGKQSSVGNVPFNKPLMLGTEIDYIRQAVEKRRIAGDGYFSDLCSRWFEEQIGAKKVLLTPSGTHALEMAAILTDLQPGDEVIVPSFTFVSTANAFALRGAKIVFADIRKDTLNLDESQLANLITSKTRIIVPVHYAGVACEMDPICEITEKHGICIVEDAAHAFPAAYKERKLASIGQMGILSFHETKNFTCGEGGALVVNDEALVERAEIVREKGTDRTRFFRGQCDKYTWKDIGSSYLLSDLLAAYLWAHLERSAYIQKKREHLWQSYYDALADWAKEQNVSQPIVPVHCEHSFHMFYMLMPDQNTRDRFIRFLREHNIASVFHYVPLHLSDMGKRFGGFAGQCPVTEDISGRLVRLPFYTDMRDDELQYVIDTVRRFQV